MRWLPVICWVTMTIPAATAAPVDCTAPEPLAAGAVATGTLAPGASQWWQLPEGHAWDGGGVRAWTFVQVAGTTQGGSVSLVFHRTCEDTACTLWPDPVFPLVGGSCSAQGLRLLEVRDVSASATDYALEVTIGGAVACAPNPLGPVPQDRCGTVG